MFEDRRIQAFVMAAVCVFYVAVRLWRLTDSCLWFDELFSVHAAEHGLGSLTWFVALDLIHPPLFYVFLKFWIAIGGDSLLWLRLFPILFSVIALIPFLLLSRELKLSLWTIALALFLFAVNGPMIKWAQFVRMYTLLMCLSLFSIWLLARYLISGKGLVALTIVNVFLVYTHYYGWLVLAAEVATILTFQRPKWRSIGVMTGIVFASFIPWLYLVSVAATSGSELSQNISWVERPGLSSIASFALDLVKPFYYRASSAEPSSIYSISVPLLLIVMTAAVLFMLKWKREPEDEKQAVYFLSIFAFLPILAVFLASWIMPHSIWGERHLIIVVPPLMFLIAIVLTRFNDEKLRTSAITLVILFSGYAFYLQAARDVQPYVWCGWEPVAKDFASAGRDSRPKRIYAFEDLVAYHLWFALRNTSWTQVSVVKGVEGMMEDSSFFLPRGFDAVARAELKDIAEPHIWLALRTDKAGQEFPLFEILADMGYTRCRLSYLKFGTSTVYLVEMAKDKDECTH